MTDTLNHGSIYKKEMNNSFGPCDKLLLLLWSTKILNQHLHRAIPYIFDDWADPVVCLLPLKSYSMPQLKRLKQLLLLPTLLKK